MSVLMLGRSTAAMRAPRSVVQTRTDEAEREREAHQVHQCERHQHTARLGPRGPPTGAGDIRIPDRDRGTSDACETNQLDDTDPGIERVIE